MQDHGHIGGSMSIADVLSVIMNDFDIKKDEIIFSKGHASPALYSAFYLNNIIHLSWVLNTAKNVYFYRYL